MQRAAAEPEKPDTNALLVDEELQPLVLEPDEGALAFGDFGRGFQQRFATGLASLASAALRGVRVGGRLLKKAGGGIGRVANATVVGFRSPQPDADSDDEGSSTELLDKSATQRTLPSSARDDSQLLERADDEATWVEFFGLLVVAGVEILRNASQILLQFLLVALAMMLLTILVDLLLPFEVAPEQAIKRSLSLATIAKQWYEFARGVLNGLGGVLNAFIPGWNSFSQYVFSQVVFFSVKLASRMISFFLDDMSDNASAGDPGNPDLFFAMTGNPFQGFSCAATDSHYDQYSALDKRGPDAHPPLRPEDLGDAAAYTAMAWCGIKGWYRSGATGVTHARRLGARLAAEGGGYWPASFASARAMREAAGGQLGLGPAVVEIATAPLRRALQKDQYCASRPPSSAPIDAYEQASLEIEAFICGEGEVLEEVGRVVHDVLNLLQTIVSTVVGFEVYLLGSVADLIFHVLYVIFDNLAVVFGDLVILLIHVAFELLLTLVGGVEGTGKFLWNFLRSSVGFIVAFLIDMVLPFVELVINLLVCSLDLINVDGWNDQLRCAHEHCFAQDGAADVVAFFDFYAIMDYFFKLFADLFNLGRSLGNAPPFDFSSAKVWGRVESQALNNSRGCSKCFTCKVSEGRLVSYIIMSLASCFDPSHYQAFSHNVQQRCQPNGSFYQEVCVGDLNTSGGNRYLEDAFDPVFLTGWANRFLKDSQDWGQSTLQGQKALALANDWQSVTGGAARAFESPREAAQDMFKRACLYSEMGVVRSAADNNLDPRFPYYPGADYFKYAPDPITFEATGFLYDSCKASSYDGCYSTPLRWISGEALELSNCFFDKAGCIKGRELCLGRCGERGPRQDFFTDASKRLLAGKEPAYAADCRAERPGSNFTYDVYLFGQAGEARSGLAEELRARSGLTGVDWSTAPRQIEELVRKSLAGDDGLAYLPGRGIVLDTQVPPPPPPPPRPAQGPAPVHHKSWRPPPPPPPAARPAPLWCGPGQGVPLPMVRAVKSYRGDPKVHGKRTRPITSTRDVCLYARRVLDAGVTASRCFEDSGLETGALVRSGRVWGIPASRVGPDARTAAQILSDRAEFGAGRRLAEYQAADGPQARRPYGAASGAAITHSLGSFQSLQRLLLGVAQGGATEERCADLCNANTSCLAFATRVDYLGGRDTGECLLLRGLGACSLRDFAAQLGEGVASAAQYSARRGAAAPLGACVEDGSARCLRLPTLLTNTRLGHGRASGEHAGFQRSADAVLDHETARAACVSRTPPWRPTGSCPRCHTP